MGTDVEDTALSQNAGKGQPEDRAGVSEKKGALQGQTLWAQEPIQFLIREEDEPNFKGTLPPEWLLPSHLSLGLILPSLLTLEGRKDPQRGLCNRLPKARLSCHEVYWSLTSSQVLCPFGVSGWRGLGRDEEQEKGAC